MNKRVVEDLLYIESNKNKATQEGYYLISVGNKYGYSNGYFHNNKYCSYIGKYKDGIMRDLITDTVLKYYDDISISYKPNEEKNKLYFLYESPCYVKATLITDTKLLDCLNIIKNNSDFFTYSDKIYNDINTGSDNNLDLKPDYINIGKKVFKLKQEKIISNN